MTLIKHIKKNFFLPLCKENKMILTIFIHAPSRRHLQKACTVSVIVCDTTVFLEQLSWKAPLCSCNVFLFFLSFAVPAISLCVQMCRLTSVFSQWSYVIRELCAQNTDVSLKKGETMPVLQVVICVTVTIHISWAYCSTV